MPQRSNSFFIDGLLVMVGCFVLVQESMASNTSPVLRDQIADEIYYFLTEESDQDLDYAPFYEKLFFRSQHPFNLNTLTGKDLESLLFLTDDEIEAILMYRLEQGEFLSLNQLVLIPFFTPDKINWLKSFVYLGPKAWVKPTLKEEFRMVSQNLYFMHKPENKSTDYLRLNYSYVAGHVLKASLSLEQDASETFGSYLRNDEIKGFVEFSPLQYAHKDKSTLYIKRIIVGDYQVRMGQGLLLSQGSFLSSSLTSSSFRMPTQALHPTASSTSNILRGVASSLSYKNTDYHLFLSYTDIDTHLSSGGFSSISTLGLHNTHTISTLDRVGCFTSGLRAERTRQHYALGFTTYYSHFSKPWQASSPLLQATSPRGQHMGGVSLDYLYKRQSLALSGEMALDLKGYLASCLNILLRPMSSLSCWVALRYYPEAYQAWLSSSLSTNSRVNNEVGLLMGTQFLWRSSTFNLYWDVSKNSAPTYHYQGVRQTQKVYFNWQYPLEHQTLKLKLKGQTQTGEETDEGALFPHEVLREKLSISASIDQDLGLKTRLKLMLQFGGSNLVDDLYGSTGVLNSGITSAGNNTPDSLSGAGDNDDLESEMASTQETVDLGDDLVGSGLGLELSQQSKTRRWEFRGRVEVFDVPNFNSRLYFYESQLPHYYYVPALYGQGYREYLMGRYTIEGLTIYGKISYTSAWMAQSGDKKEEAQVRILLNYSF